MKIEIHSRLRLWFSLIFSINQLIASDFLSTMIDVIDYSFWLNGIVWNAECVSGKNIGCVASVSSRVIARKLEISSQRSRRTRAETLATQARENTSRSEEVEETFTVILKNASPPPPLRPHPRHFPTSNSVFTQKGSQANNTSNTFPFSFSWPSRPPWWKWYIAPERNNQSGACA